MLTFREIRNCEGYYYNLETGEIVRNVGPGHTRCWSEGKWSDTVVIPDIDAPQFELVTLDVLAPFETVQREIAARYARPAPTRVINRQAAMQLDGSIISDEAEGCAAGTAEGDADGTSRTFSRR